MHRNRRDENTLGVSDLSNSPSWGKNASFSGEDYPVLLKKVFGRVAPELIRSKGLL